MSHHQNARQNHNINIDNKSLRNMAKVQIFGNITKNEHKVVPGLN